MPVFWGTIGRTYTSGVLDLGRLRVLAAVAREGSITAAAESLHYAQPSVSHQLARLEAEVGMPLLQRMGRGIRLTDAGRLLAQRAEEILAQVESAHTELEELAGMRTGRVRLAAFPSALATIVPAAAAAILSAYPGIELSLTEAEPPEAFAALRAGDIDAAVVFEYGEPPAVDRRDTTLIPLFEEPLYIVTPRLPAPDSGRELRDFAQKSWIAGCERCREHLVDACKEVGFTPRVDFETDDYVAVQALVAGGLGVSLLPGLTLRANRHPDVALHRVPGLQRHVFVAHYGRPPESRPAQVLLDALRANLPASNWEANFR